VEKKAVERVLKLREKMKEYGIDANNVWSYWYAQRNNYNYNI
jgi:hypothetical protein